MKGEIDSAKKTSGARHAFPQTIGGESQRLKLAA